MCVCVCVCGGGVALVRVVFVFVFVCVRAHSRMCTSVCAKVHELPRTICRVHVREWTRRASRYLPGALGVLGRCVRTGRRVLTEVVMRVDAPNKHRSVTTRAHRPRRGRHVPDPIRATRGSESLAQGYEKGIVMAST